MVRTFWAMPLLSRSGGKYGVVEVLILPPFTQDFVGNFNSMISRFGRSILDGVEESHDIFTQVSFATTALDIVEVSSVEVEHPNLSILRCINCLVRVSAILWGGGTAG